MKPRGPLMIEHRLIEKMLRLMDKETARMGEGYSVDPVFIDTAVDFIRTYADRTHHGKEEDILFTSLLKKRMKDADKALMEELVEEHRQARSAVEALVKAKEAYQDGNGEAYWAVREKMVWLIRFYPSHIRKEDKVFFPNTEAYFSAKEMEKMLADFREFDGKMIHEKYEKLVDGLTSRYQE
jgi:hemerythrin-like domain-containing protein